MTENNTAATTWRGVAQMECCMALRELMLTGDDARPQELFCYRCGRVEPVARLARWEVDHE